MTGSTVHRSLLLNPEHFIANVTTSNWQFNLSKKKKTNLLNETLSFWGFSGVMLEWIFKLLYPLLLSSLGKL